MKIGMNDEYNCVVSKNKATVMAYGYFHAPVPSYPQYPNGLVHHYDKDHLTFYWLLKAESGL